MKRVLLEKGIGAKRRDVSGKVRQALAPREGYVR